MPIGQLIVPGLRDGGMPWELITGGLGSQGVEPGGQFKKHNPGCNCCGCVCEDATVFLAISGFTELSPGDPDDCLRVNGFVGLPYVATPQEDVVPCDIDVQPSCWFSRSFVGPDGEVWYWEVGINGTNRATNGWLVVVHLLKAIDGSGIWWKGGLPGGYVPYNGGLDGLQFTLTELNQCDVVNYDCPPSVQTIEGTATCSVVGNCAEVCPNNFQLNVSGVTAAFCATCNNLNTTYLLPYARGPQQTLTKCGFPGYYGDACDWEDLELFPCSGLPIPTLTIWTFRIRRIAPAQWQTYLSISSGVPLRAQQWVKTVSGNCDSLSWTFTPDDLCDESNDNQCDWSAAEIEVIAVP